MSFFFLKCMSFQRKIYETKELQGGGTEAVPQGCVCSKAVEKLLKDKWAQTVSSQPSNLNQRARSRREHGIKRLAHIGLQHTD
jgi:hypothetical protein